MIYIHSYQEFLELKERKDYNDIKELSLSIQGKLEPGDLPNSLTFLRLNRYNHSLESEVFPNSLTTLVLENYKIHLKPGDLPNSLTTLDLTYYRHTLEPGDLPNSLEYLDLEGYDKPLDSGVLPDSLGHLKIYKITKELIPPKLTELNSISEELNEFVKQRTLKRVKETLKPFVIDAVLDHIVSKYI